MDTLTDLTTVTDRMNCDKCKKSVKYYCYKCFLPRSDMQIPEIVLPVKLDILKHAKENDGKSTAIHARLVSPQSVRIFTYPDQLSEIDDDLNEGTFILFPSNSARTVEQIGAHAIKRLVVIDGTWSQAKSMLNNPKLVKLPHLTIGTYETKFWRYQSLGKHCLSTIEAIYYFYKEYSGMFGHEDNCDYDSLLYFFKYFYDLIQNTYKENPEKKFITKHQENYIKYE